ncbi:MAG: carbohydrate kinase [Pseudomonadota bacterium]
MFLCCGDALFDMFAGKSAGTSVNLQGHVGGSPMNVATGLARFGHHSRYFTKLSSDLFGQRMRLHFDSNGIDVSPCLHTDLNTTLAIVETQPDGSAAYVFYTDNTADVSIREEELPDKLPEEIRIVHFGSYSTAVSPTSESLMALAARESASRLISYDPNLRPTIEPDIDKWRQVFNGYAASATVIKASDEDIATLLGKNREDQFVADCFNHGAKLVFITRGSDGASGFSASGEVNNVPGVSVDVVDTVGAGDTFQAAVLHWLVAENHLLEAADDAGNLLQGTVDLSACMTFAVKAAAVTCTRSGADLPTLAEVQAG